MLVLIETQVALALLFAGAKEAVSRGKFGHDQAAAGSLLGLRWTLITGRRHNRLWLLCETGIADEAAENCVRNASHRRQYRGWRNAHIPNLHTLRHSRT